jgi:hypothetical protein
MRSNSVGVYFATLVLIFLSESSLQPCLCGIFGQNNVPLVLRGHKSHANDACVLVSCKLPRVIAPAASMKELPSVLAELEFAVGNTGSTNACSQHILILCNIVVVGQVVNKVHEVLSIAQDVELVSSSVRSFNPCRIFHLITCYH